jgi:hypothetical protein
VVTRNIDRSLAVIEDERSQLSGQAEQVREMFRRLKAILGILRAPQADRSAGGGPDVVAPGEQPSEARDTTYVPDVPLTLILDGVDDFDLLVRLHRIITEVPAVASSAIESYHDGQTHFIIQLRDVVSSQTLVGALEAGLDSPVQLATAETDPPELRLDLTRAA